MNIYISELKCDSNVTRHKLCAEAINAALKLAGSRSCACYRSDEYCGYDEIERKILDSSIFFAIIDQYWASSTWKCHEFTFANGGLSIRQNGAIGPIIPTIAFVVPDTKLPKFIQESIDHPLVVNDIKSLSADLNSLIESMEGKC